MKTTLLLALFAMTGLWGWAAETPVGVTDLKGGAHTLWSGDEARPVVLVFVSPYCPTSNAFLPEINRIAAAYGERVRFYLVQSDPSVKKADAVKQAELFEIKATVLLDPGQQVARRAKAQVTPEVVVFRRAGETLYQGRINDLYINPTRKRPEPTTHDLVAALDEILAGKTVTTPLTKAMGCRIPEPN